MKENLRICPDCRKDFSHVHKLCSFCGKALWIYERPDEKSRFVLGEVGEKPLICFGVNSSTARPGVKNLDRTLSSVRRVAQDEKFDGWIMLNLYPQRATKPDDMHKNHEFSESLHEENLKHIKKIFKDCPKATVWTAWGGLIMKRAFLKDCLKDIVSAIGLNPVTWVHRGALLRNGHPHHPLYLKKDVGFNDFDMKKYLDNLNGCGR